MPEDLAAVASRSSRAAPFATISILAFDGVDDLDFFGAWSVLRKAADAGRTLPAHGVVNCSILAIGGTFTTASGLTIAVPHALGQWKTDALIVPGGAGAVAAAGHRDLRAILTRLRSEGTRFYTVCSGSVFLAACGLLQGMRVAIHGSKHHLLGQAGCAGVVGGLHSDGWLTSIGGVRSPSVKSVELAFRAVEDFCPLQVDALRTRMEISTATGRGG